MALLLLTLLIVLVLHLGQPAHVNVRIVSGKETKPHSRPYMISVQKNGRHICGGFLVSDHFVMTAAHCWDGGRKLTVVLGTHASTNSKSDHVPVKFYHIHPKYDSDKLFNDIMLLQLTKPIHKSSTVDWISIPDKDKDIKVGQVCSIAGWGKQTENGGISKLLMEVNVTVTNGKECAKSWKDRSLQRIVCTKGHGGFCQGDSGGPLVCKNRAVGIISFYNEPCDMSKLPYVYTKISAFLPWIKCIVNSMK